MTELVKKGVQHLLQEALEQEVTYHLGRGHYERRREEEPHRGYRSGYKPKAVKTSEGRVELKVPQVRETLEPYRSRFVPLIGRKSALLEHPVSRCTPLDMTWRTDIIMAFDKSDKIVSEQSLKEGG